MNILLSNDDGIHSLGLRSLKKILEKDFNVFVSAPSKERSATSQALTIFRRMLVEKISDNFYSVGGFPTDCVNIGLFGNIFPKIDMVISGINRGVNMGHDVHYSGTVGAARHGAVHGLYSLALSSGNRTENYDYERESVFISDFIKQKLDKLKKGIVYNINFPLEYSHDINEMVVCHLGERTYSDNYHIAEFKENKFHYLLALTEMGYKIAKGTDFESYHQGKITITPISLNTTHEEELIFMREYFL